MRHKGTVSETKLSRNKLLVRMFREVLGASPRPLTTPEICEEIARRPVERYYLSEERGYSIYSKWLNHRELPQGSPWGMQMYLGYIRECDLLVLAGMKPWEAARKAVYNRACCIGLSPDRIYRIVLDEWNRRKERK
jgi:hypothetical protein